MSDKSNERKSFVLEAEVFENLYHRERRGPWCEFSRLSRLADVSINQISKVDAWGKAHLVELADRFVRALSTGDEVIGARVIGGRYPSVTCEVNLLRLIRHDE